MMEFVLKATFSTTAQALFAAWLSSEHHSAMTGGSAEMSHAVGEDFQAWDGYIHGKNIEIEPTKRIVQSWRAAEFEDYHEDSKLELHFDNVDGRAALTLIHSNLPDAIGEQYKKGWDDFYFKPMTAFFSKR